MTPGRKPSSRTSARSRSSRADSRPTAFLRSIDTTRRPRSTRSRLSSAGAPGRTIRTTSAPMSASSMAANGAGPIPANSTIRRPESGPLSLSMDSASAKVREKARHRGKHRLRLIAMRRVPAFGKLEAVQLWDRARGTVDLLDGSVLVLEALDRQHRAADLPEHGLDVPDGEIGIEPDIVPAPERAFDVVVITRELFAQIGLEIRDARASYAVEAVRFDEDERRHRHDRRHGSTGARGVDERYRGALAVSEQDRLAHVERVQELRQRLERLDVHEVDAEGPGERFGCAISAA